MPSLASGYESGPVRALVAEVSADAELRLPKRIYAGYPALVSVASPARLAAAATVILERRAGGRWRPVVREPFHAAVTKLVARLPAGRQSIRVVVSTGAARSTGPARAVTVLREGRRATSRRDDGRYRARPAKKGTTLSFSVARGGRELRAFKASVPASCVGPSVEANRIVLAQTALSRARVAPDGAVVEELRVVGGRELLTGRLRRGRFVERVDVQFANCEGGRRLSATMR